MDGRGSPHSDAAERRLAEALRAQASLGARTSTPAAPPARPGRPQTSRPDRSATSNGPIRKNPAQKNSAHGPGPQPGPGRSPRRDGGTRPGPDGEPTGHVDALDADISGAPTARQPSAHAAAASPPSTPPASAARAVAPGVASPDLERQASPLGSSVRLHWALLAALLAGVFLGCLLAVLSVLDPGLLPALG